MKILHLSDTHGFHAGLKDMPEGDVIVHSGDFTMAGSEREVIEFLYWFLSLPYAHKIFVAGNHDACLCEGRLTGLPGNCHCLDNDGVEIDGIKFYGMPMHSSKCMTGRNEDDIAKIPDGVDVLVTHQPPYGFLDYDGKRRYGSKALLSKVNEARPRLHLFGHIHSGYGIESQGDTVFYNSAIVSDDYKLCNQPHVIDI